MNHFSKYHGLGNDFIMVDLRSSGLEDLKPWRAWAKQVTKRGHGIGADGVILATEHPRDNRLQMTVINGDGSVPEMCGNGLRCFIHFAVRELGYSTSKLQIHTGAGLLESTWKHPDGGEDFSVTVNMGNPSMSPPLIPFSPSTNPALFDGTDEPHQVIAVTMGNPHGVIFTDSPRDRVWMKRFALSLEASDWFPEGVNTGFALLKGSDIQLTVHERGCGFTEACGTGACAALVAAVSSGRVPAGQPTLVHLPGGALSLTWDGPETPVWMTGPSAFIFSGESELPMP